MIQLISSLLLLTGYVVGTVSTQLPEKPLTLLLSVQSRGILTLSFNPSKPASESLDIVRTTEAGTRPGWITEHDDNIYTVSRLNYSDDKIEEGGLFAFKKGHGASSSLELMNSVPSGGLGGVACDVAKDGRTIAVASIDGSTVSVHPLGEEGGIGQASTTFHYYLSDPGPGANGTQTIAGPHQAAFDPSGEYLIVPDRSSDVLYVYHVAGPLKVTRLRTIHLEPGTGPRHVKFRVASASRTYMYLVGELDNTIRTFQLDGVNNGETANRDHKTAGNLKLKQVQLLSTLGANRGRSDPDNVKNAAEVALSNDGKFAYVSNRNSASYDDSDFLAIYSVDAGNGRLYWVGRNSTFGKTPRHFSLSKDPESRYAAIGNEVSNSVVVLERDAETGFFSAMRGNLSVGEFDTTQLKGPTCVLWT